MALDGAFKLNQLGIPAVAGDIWEAIYSLRVRGAPAIGAAAAFGMVLGWQELASRYADFSQETLLIEVQKNKNFLLSTSPDSS